MDNIVHCHAPTPLCCNDPLVIGGTHLGQPRVLVGGALCIHPLPIAMQQDLPPQIQEVESIPLHQWCQLELGSCHHTAVQPLDSMEIACLYASHGVLGVKANKIRGQDVQNA